MTTGKKNKAIAAVSFLLITISVVLTVHTTIPGGPWEGIYPIFAPAWVLLGVASILLVTMPGLHRLRILGATLLLATISLMTLRWGTTFAIRDSWIHLGFIRDGNYLTESRYPAFHGGVEALSIVTGIPTDSIIIYTSPFAAVIGTTLIAAVALRLTDRSLRTASIAALVLVPAIAVDFNDRPIAFAAVCVLSLVWLSLAPINQQAKSVIIIVASSVTLLTHPLIFLVYILFVGAITGCRYLSDRRGELVNIIGFPSRNLQITKRNFVLSIGVIFSAYFFYWLSVGQRVVAGTVVTLLTTSESSTESTDGSTAVLYDIPAHILETSAMGAVVITTGALAAVGYYLSYRRGATSHHHHQFTALVSIFATGCLVAIFIMVDILSPIGFPAIRAVPLAPILLIPGAIIGLRQLDTRRNVAIPVFVVVLLVGLAVMFPSPLTGTTQQSSTPSDIERTDWLVEHQDRAPVIEAENTYEIARAYYGSQEMDQLSNGDTWAYQSTTREESYPWQVKHSDEQTLIVNHHLTRLKAASDGEQESYKRFESESSKVYSGGNSEVYWTN